MQIFTINNKTEEKFLRIKTANFDFSKHSKKDIDELIKKMKSSMIKANGIGLSANQIGLDLQLFVAQISDEPLKRGKNNKIILPSSKSMKSYIIFNPKIAKFSKKETIMEEGCLSVPGIYGEVERPEKITLEGYDRYGRKKKIKAEELLARVFQHEIDHLNGILFIDRAKNLHKTEINRNL
ncbi:MAG: peptide deformylase [Patescibacteria group bacterium]